MCNHPVEETIEKSKNALGSGKYSVNLINGGGAEETGSHPSQRSKTCSPNRGEERRGEVTICDRHRTLTMGKVWIGLFIK
jgi:hypothetical protein